MAHIERRETRGWETRYDVRWRVGRTERSKSFKLFRSAEAFKRRVESGSLVGLVTNPKAGDERLEPYAVRWVETRLVRGRPLAPATRYGYESLLRRDVRPYALARLPLRQIDPEAVRTWHGEVIAASGVQQAAKAYRVVRAVLNTAVDDELIYRNPCRIKGAGTEHWGERPMPSTGDVLDLIEAMTPRYRVVCALAGLGGLRTGEILGLRHCDIDPAPRGGARRPGGAGDPRPRADREGAEVGGGGADGRAPDARDGAARRAHGELPRRTDW